MKYFRFYSFISIVGLALLMAACGSKQKSATTGWEYNNPKNGGFQVADYAGQVTGPGLILIEGGTFTMRQIMMTRVLSGMHNQGRSQLKPFIWMKPRSPMLITSSISIG